MLDTRIQTLCAVTALIIAIIVSRNELYDFIAPKIIVLAGLPVWVYFFTVCILLVASLLLGRTWWKACNAEHRRPPEG